jgi:hypothetical protein
MSTNYRPYSLQRRNQRHDFVLPDVKPDLCVYAADFSVWAETHLAQALKDVTLVGLAQAKLLLTDQFFQHRALAPKNHRSLTSTGKSGRGHRCLWAVFEDAYLQLKAAELKLSPPKLYEPTPDPPMASSSMAANLVPGIYIGEQES